MKNLNIALLHYSCPPVVGGVEEVVSQQAFLFQRYFQKVKIFTGMGAQFSDYFQVEINPLLGSRNKKILNAHKLAKGENLKPIESLTLKIYKYLKRSLQDFDILIAHNILTMRYNLPLTHALLRLAEEDFIPIIGWDHDSPYFYHDYPSYLDEEPWSILKQYNSKVYYVVISESRKRQFEKLYGKGNNIHVVPNGIDPITFFGLSPLTIRLIQEQNLFDADFLIVQPSRLHPRKNVELSIRVLRALKDMGINVRLLITGTYDPHESRTVEYYKKILSLARKLNVKKDVLMTAEYKFKSGQRLVPSRIIMRDLYLISDILFMPSIQEGFGLPLLESGMIKLPVVCSNISPFKEVGGNEVCLFKLSETPEEIAEKILNLLSIRKSNRFFRRVIKDYTWDNIYKEKLLPLLTEIKGKNLK